MGLIKAFSGVIGGALADQWLEIVTTRPFDEHTLVSPGIVSPTNAGRGANVNKSDYLLSKGSLIYVPENTAAFVFSDAGISDISFEPGGYTFQMGSPSIFAGNLPEQIANDLNERISFGGIPNQEHKVAFINLREIRNIRFGTKGPQVYHDLFYDVDFEIRAYGVFSVKVSNPVVFVQNFLPAGEYDYSVDAPEARAQLVSEVLQSLISSMNRLSTKYRFSDLLSHIEDLCKTMTEDERLGAWNEKYGIELTGVTIENIEYTDDSRELVKQYSANKMGVDAYNSVTDRAAAISAQQNISKGIRDNGIGDGGGVVLGASIASDISDMLKAEKSDTKEDILESLRKYKKLLDEGLITEEDYEKKKKEILEL